MEYLRIFFWKVDRVEGLELVLLCVMISGVIWGCEVGLVFFGGGWEVCLGKIELEGYEREGSGESGEEDLFVIDEFCCVCLFYLSLC